MGEMLYFGECRQMIKAYTKYPYHRPLPSTRDNLKESTESLKNLREVLDKIYSSSGDVYDKIFLIYLPRGLRNIYDARATAEKVSK